MCERKWFSVVECGEEGIVEMDFHEGCVFEGADASSD